MNSKGERRAAKKRRREQRKVKRRDRSAVVSKDWPDFDRPYDDERIFRRVCLAVAEEEERVGRFNHAVAQYRRGELDLSELPSDPIERAQEWMFQAMEAGPVAGAALVAQALEIDPGCPDAMSYRAVFLEDSPERACADCEAAVRIAQERLGPAFFEQYSGEVDERPEALPLMRSADRYRAALVKAQRLEEAILSARESLALGYSEPDDLKLNLIIWLLTVGNHASAQELIEGWDGDPSGEMLWAEVLERFQAGDLAAAEDVLRLAERAYPGVQGLLSAARPMPEVAEDRGLPADELVAVLVARDLAPAWRATPGAQAWLGQQRS